MLSVKHQLDQAVLRFVVRNYKRLKMECSAAQKASHIQHQKIQRVIVKSTKSKRDARLKDSRSLVGQIAVECGCSRDKAVEAKKIVCLFLQHKIVLSSLLAVLRGQKLMREILYGCGVVYLVSDGANVKIGCTKFDAATRAKKLCTAVGTVKYAKLKVIAELRTNDPHKLEKKLHCMFAAKRIAGEWFNLSQTDVTTIVAKLKH
jgi:hypothetical protein